LPNPGWDEGEGDGPLVKFAKFEGE